VVQPKAGNRHVRTFSTPDGRKLRVRSLINPDTGQGTGTFVLVHGIGMSSRCYRPLAAELARHGNVHAIEMPGFGSTRRPGTTLSLAGLARCVSDVLGRLGVERPVLVGHSMGCQVVVEMALQHPDAWKGLVLLGPTINRAERTGPMQALRLAQDSLREPPRVNAIVFSDYLRSIPQYFRTLPRMLSQRLEERIGGVAVPVLLIRGENDPIAPEAWIHELAAACPGALTATVPGEAHVLMYKSPETVARHCLKLLRTV
jgi:pimeloyl-ACP methyl ester carboxylesterase